MSVKMETLARQDKPSLPLSVKELHLYSLRYVVASKRLGHSAKVVVTIETVGEKSGLMLFSLTRTALTAGEFEEVHEE